MKINKIRNNSKRIRGKKEATKELRKLQKKIKVARKKRCDFELLFLKF